MNARERAKALALMIGHLCATRGPEMGIAIASGSKPLLAEAGLALLNQIAEILKPAIEEAQVEARRIIRDEAAEIARVASFQVERIDNKLAARRVKIACKAIEGSIREIEIEDRWQDN